MDEHTNVYAPLDEQHLNFKFSSPHKSSKKQKRPQSANIRITGSKTKPKFSKRNTNNAGVLRMSKEDIAGSESQIDPVYAFSGYSGMREHQQTYPSYFKSPSIVQK